MTTVLVTGGSGFVGSHTILALLAQGYDVRTTLRNMARKDEVLAMLASAGCTPGDKLSFAVADLERDAGWVEAVEGCDFVLHVASPLPSAVPKDENEIIVPAREGTLRVLRAARDAGVKRVVVTSSFAAIGYGVTTKNKIFDENDWSNPDHRDVQPYIKSKILAERAAWNFIAEEGRGLELTVLNPVGILGPVLGTDYAASIMLVKRLMEGMPAVPRIYFGVVDVRDLADLHVRAMTSARANGQRFLATSGTVVSLMDIASILRERLGRDAANIPRRQSPDWIIRLMALFNPTAKAVLPQLGIIRRATNTKAREWLDWQPRPAEETLVNTARSLLEHGVVKPRR